MCAAGPYLRCANLRKAFPGVLALDDVDLEVGAGSVHALVGENGAGKSTLVKILSGAIRADAGRIFIDGHLVDIADALAARRLGIAIVYQDFSLVPDLSVGENILLGRWPRSPRTRCVDFARLDEQASGFLSRLGIAIPVRLPVSRLSVAQQQMVEIAKALSLDARILILDEPSAVLTPHELTTLFRLIRDVAARGVSVIYISHRLDEIFDIADTVTVLRNGRRISTRSVAELRGGSAGMGRERLIAEMVGRELKDEFPPRKVTMGEIVLCVKNLSVPGRFADVSFTVCAGEVLALTGLVGSGRTSVARALFGALGVGRRHGAARGTVTVAGKSGPFSSPRQAIAAGVAMLPEDRKQEGLLMGRNVRENMTLADRHVAAIAGFLRVGWERRFTGRLMGDLRVRAPGSESLVSTLSGGNQQKVLLARWMTRPYRIMVLDEPTRGVDVGAKYEIYTLINRLAAAGTAIVMISSELPEVIGMADRIAVMYEGQLMGVLDNASRQVTQEQIMTLAAGERSMPWPQ